jgi:hypothetical protein
MITEIDDNDQEWVRTYRKVNGKTVCVRIPLEECEREQEAIRMAKEQQAAEEKAEQERQAAKAEQERRAAKLAALTPLQATIILARRGNQKVLPILRQTLKEHPELVSHYGSLSLQVQENWLHLVAGKNLLLAESLRLHLDAMRSELAGPQPSPLDKLLVDRILACHVQVLYFDAMETTDPTAENMRVARYRMDRRDQAHRQFLSAVRMLATVRNLVARTNVIQIELLHPPMVRSPVAPISKGANGEEPMVRAQTMQAEKSPLNGAAWPINRINGVNGHYNRFADVLEPATAK